MATPGDVPAVAEGRAGVQDEGSQLVAHALAAAPLDGTDERWLDLCAGPGGKAALLAALAAARGARLVANELQPHRADLVRRTLAGADGVEEVTVEDGTAPPWPAGSFDRVLVDAPCTGLGALRRRPEARWRRRPEDLARLVPLQRALLDRALDLVRPGASSLYATCSPVLAETRDVLGSVLVGRDDMTLGDAAALLTAAAGLRADVPDCAGPLAGTVQLWPHRHAHGRDVHGRCRACSDEGGPERRSGLLGGHPPRRRESTAATRGRMASAVRRDRGGQPGGQGDQPRPRLLPRGRAGRPSSTWSSTTSASAPASSTRCSSGRCMLHRFPTGLSGEKVHQKRLPSGAPDWVETVRLHFPRWNRTADELCVTELGAVIWAVQMSTVEFHPWNSRREDPEKPDEWRIDLDPGPLSDFAQVQRVAGVIHEILDELGAVGYPKTSGGKGLHVYVRDHARPRPQGGTPCRARLRPRGRAPDARRRDHAVVAQGPRPPPPVRRLQPERPRPHHRRGVLRARLPRRPGLDAGALGRGRRRATPTTSRSSPSRSASPSSATCTRTSTTMSSTSQPLREWADRDEANGLTSTTGRGRRRPDEDG